MSYNNGSRIVTDELQLFLDAGNIKSYPKSGATWGDISKNNRSVTFYNAGGTTYSSNPAGAPTYSTGNNGTFTLDGVNDWGKFSQFTIGSAVTVSIWLKTSNAGGGGLLSHCSGGPVNIGYQISGGKMHYQYYNASWQNVTGTSTISDGTWKNCVWAKTGTSMLMYINGVLDATLTLTGDISGPLCCVGSLWGPCNSDSYGAGTDSYGSVYSGDIGLVLIHGYRLSASEVLQNYNATKGRFGLS